MAVSGGLTVPPMYCIIMYQLTVIYYLLTLLCFCPVLVTGMILRSDVFVDIVAKIEIITTTRELLLGEPPEVCHIQAFDTEGKIQQYNITSHTYMYW